MTITKAPQQKVATQSLALNARAFVANELILIAAAALCAGMAIWYVATPFMGVATGSYILMLAGFILRKKREFHVPLMLAAIAVDLSVVAILEVERDAVKTAMSFSLGLVPQLHIAASATAVALYFPLLALGFLLLRGSPSARLRRAHRALGLSAFAFRSLGFAFMFSLLLSRHAG